MYELNFFKNKEILITGGTGLVGNQLTNLLLDSGANLTIASLDDPNNKKINIEYVKTDLRYLDKCIEITKNKEIVFNLVGIKGSPAMALKKPASFFVPTITFSINMMEAARRNNVNRYLYTSSVGVYSPSEVFYEDDVWKTFPSDNDKFAGWAKRMGELQAEAYKIEHNWNNISIVRPANVYGPFDNFDPKNAMVIPSLIHRISSGENPLLVWGDGSPIRDFIHARDVAHGMLMAVYKEIDIPINLGSGKGYTIEEIANIVCKNAPNGPVDIKWDKSKPSGDKKRIMDISRARSYGFNTTIDIEKGIKETIEWYQKNKLNNAKRYNAFTENI
ncbi:MAG: hypothetical protein CL393_07315 [Acidiferrobacteraceae bacterium]|jgi:GDP-L-fucose synthase|nr:hypothetical protein [Acidiferrobacteraceae bacterium]|tara:strand:- start:1912 stop:2907 length:996 start_codon:yes stop_codon:yes gene_type:complete